MNTVPRPKGRGYGRYHFYRQDSDGLWSHKHGSYPVTRLDGYGYMGEDDTISELIIDPLTCNRNEYTIFVGYFAVTPWQLYEEENY